MQLDKASSSLYVAFSTCVIKVPLGRCERHGKCKKYVFASLIIGCSRCLGKLTVILFLQNLYCFQRPLLWVGKGSRCVRPSVAQQQVRSPRRGRVESGLNVGLIVLTHSTAARPSVHIPHHCDCWQFSFLSSFHRIPQHHTCQTSN